MPEIATASQYELGCFERCPDGRNSGFGSYSKIRCENDLIALMKDATSLAFQQACTGAGSCYRETGAIYQVRNTGDVVFSIEVTPKGSDDIVKTVKRILKSPHKDEMRQWAFGPSVSHPEYCQKSDSVLCGDTAYVVENFVLPYVKPGTFVFDGLSGWNDLQLTDGKPFSVLSLPAEELSARSRA
ncbi:hypothetical protein [Tritonibacter mobilis]|uniref:hypothetical protein n=1 Tax=Tritonibacter mobilis TaxID=379347 RepID=UPI0013A567C8|nr:hypothetical protein [Tritonibacter mobilis]